MAAQPRVGEAAPNFTLSGTDGRRETLAQLCRDKPVVLIFGSYT